MNLFSYYLDTSTIALILMIIAGFLVFTLLRKDLQETPQKKSK